VQLGTDGAQISAGPRRVLLGIDKQANPDASVAQGAHDAADDGALPAQIESAFRGSFLPLLRHQSAEVGLDVEGDVHDRWHRCHLQIEHPTHHLAQQAHVPFLDVAPVLAQVRGDAIGTGQLAQASSQHRVRVDGVPLLAQGRDVVDVDVQANHSASAFCMMATISSA